MGLSEQGEPSNLFSYAKINYTESLDLHRHRRSFSELTPTSRNHKLHKPPTVQSLYERPRNRLQKRILTAPNFHSPTFLFVLEYEPYPYNSRPSQFLGVYSTIDSVTLAAFKHGAYTFSRDGFLDGREYLSSTGRIKILSHTVERHGAKAVVPGRGKRMLDGGAGEIVRLDIPHPTNQKDDERGKREQQTVYLAVHQGPHAAFCVGLFGEKSLAWGACLKNKTLYAVSGSLAEEERDVGVDDMPRISARLVESGRHEWFVQAHEVNGPGR